MSDTECIISQTTQWKLLETWYLDTNPKKDFTTFLRIHNFPNNLFESNGPYYAQICKKFWYANRQKEFPTQLEWVRQKMFENMLYNESDAEIGEFEHEGHLRQMNRILENNVETCLTKIHSQRSCMVILYGLLYVSSLGLIAMVNYNNMVKPWWLI